MFKGIPVYYPSIEYAKENRDLEQKQGHAPPEGQEQLGGMNLG